MARCNAIQAKHASEYLSAFQSARRLIYKRFAAYIRDHDRLQVRLSSPAVQFVGADSDCNILECLPG
jgi:hypothetical protein